MTFSFAMMLLSAAISDNSTAVVSTATNAPAQVDKKSKKLAKICKSTTMTGSRVGSRVCRTKEQWEQSESGMELGQKGAKGTLAPPQFPTGG